MAETPISTRFDERGNEHFIPPCMHEIRVASDRDRVLRNPYDRKPTPEQFQLISFDSTGDGDMYISCRGQEGGCAGGKAKVDRHDTLQDKMPESTEALAAICTSATMYSSVHGFMTTHENADSPYLPEDV